MGKDIRHQKILNMPLAITSCDGAGQWVEKAVKRPRGQYVCVANVHMCMEAHDDPEFHRVVSRADLVVPDGKPLVWGLQLLGNKQACHIRGSDLMLRLCQAADRSGIPIGLYGGTPKSLSGLKRFLKNKFRNLDIPFASSPPFRPLTREEDEQCTRKIKTSGIRILFVGLGCPKQENWMAAHSDNLVCVMVGVGAAFDFFSGQKRHAPLWMQNAGLEWLFRFASEPRRLCKRYLKHNPRFIWHFLKQFMKQNI